MAQLLLLIPATRKPRTHVTIGFASQNAQVALIATGDSWGAGIAPLQLDQRPILNHMTSKVACGNPLEKGFHVSMQVFVALEILGLVLLVYHHHGRQILLKVLWLVAIMTQVRIKRICCVAEHASRFELTNILTDFQDLFVASNLLLQFRH